MSKINNLPTTGEFAKAVTEHIKAVTRRDMRRKDHQEMTEEDWEKRLPKRLSSADQLDFAAIAHKLGVSAPALETAVLKAFIEDAFK